MNFSVIVLAFFAVVGAQQAGAGAAIAVSLSECPALAPAYEQCHLPTTAQGLQSLSDIQVATTLCSSQCISVMTSMQSSLASQGQGCQLVAEGIPSMAAGCQAMVSGGSSGAGVDMGSTMASFEQTMTLLSQICPVMAEALSNCGFVNMLQSNTQDPSTMLRVACGCAGAVQQASTTGSSCAEVSKSMDGLASASACAAAGFGSVPSPPSNPSPPPYASPPSIPSPPTGAQTAGSVMLQGYGQLCPSSVAVLNTCGLTASLNDVQAMLRATCACLPSVRNLNQNEAQCKVVISTITSTEQTCIQFGYITGGSAGSPSTGSPPTGSPPTSGSGGVSVITGISSGADLIRVYDSCPAAQNMLNICNLTPARVANQNKDSVFSMMCNVQCMRTITDNVNLLTGTGCTGLAAVFNAAVNGCQGFGGGAPAPGAPPAVPSAGPSAGPSGNGGSDSGAPAGSNSEAFGDVLARSQKSCPALGPAFATCGFVAGTSDMELGLRMCTSGCQTAMNAMLPSLSGTGCAEAKTGIPTMATFCTEMNAQRPDQGCFNDLGSDLRKCIDVNAQNPMGLCSCVDLFSETAALTSCPGVSASVVAELQQNVTMMSNNLRCKQFAGATNGGNPAPSPAGPTPSGPAAGPSTSGNNGQVVEQEMQKLALGCSELNVALKACNLTSLADLRSVNQVYSQICQHQVCKDAVTVASSSMYSSQNPNCQLLAPSLQQLAPTCQRLATEFAAAAKPAADPSVPEGCPPVEAAAKSSVCAFGDAPTMSQIQDNMCKPACFAALQRAFVGVQPSTGNQCMSLKASFEQMSKAAVEFCSAAEVKNQCPSGLRPTNCLVDPCQGATCSVAGATCVPNFCGGCSAEFYTSTGERAQCANANKCGTATCSAGEYCCNAAASKCARKNDICVAPTVVPKCPASSDGTQCSGHGQCNAPSTFCTCQSGFLGADCSETAAVVAAKDVQIKAQIQAKQAATIGATTEKNVCPANKPTLCPFNDYVLPAMRNQCAASRSECIDLSSIDGARFNCEVLQANKTFCGVDCVDVSVGCGTALTTIRACPDNAPRCATGQCPQNGECPQVLGIKVDPCAASPARPFACPDGITCVQKPSQCIATVKWNGCTAGQVKCPGTVLRCVNTTSQCVEAIGCPEGQKMCGVMRDANNEPMVTVGLEGRIRPVPICKVSCSSTVSTRQPEPLTQPFYSTETSAVTVPVTAAADSSAGASAQAVTLMNLEVQPGALSPAISGSSAPVELVVTPVAESDQLFGSFGKFAESQAISSAVIEVSPSTAVTVGEGLYLDINLNADSATGTLSEAECLALLATHAPYSSDNITNSAGADRVASCEKGTAGVCSCKFQIRHFTAYAVVDESTFVQVANAQTQADINAEATPAPVAPTASTASAFVYSGVAMAIALFALLF